MNKFWQQRSIKSRLVGITLVSTISTLAVGFALIVTLNINSLRRTMIDNTLLLARVISEYAVGSFQFRHQDALSDIFKKLEGIEEIQHARLYDKNNNAFVDYQNSRYPLHTDAPRHLDTGMIPKNRFEFKQSSLAVYHTITIRGQYYGTIYLCSTTVLLNTKIRNYVITMASTAIGLVLVSLVLALRLQRSISKPLEELSAVVQKITHEGDYSVRCQPGDLTEIAIVSNGFNTMLEQIQQRESERDKAQSDLAKALREDFRETVRNLQNLVYKVSHREDGEYVITLFEGKLSAHISTDSLINRTIQEIFGKRAAQDYLRYFDVAFDGVPTQFEMYFRQRWYLNVLEPIIEGAIVREVVGSAVDITEQKAGGERLRLSEQRYKALVEGLPIGILQSVKKQGIVRLEFVNSEFARQTGYPLEVFAEMARSESFTLPIHSDDKKTALQMWEEWIDSPVNLTLYRTYRLQIRPDEYRWFDDYATKFVTEIGEIIIIQALLDVTAKKNSEEQLQRALSKERELNALKSRFVSTVSHEFRTPLTGILLSVDLLHRYFERLTTAQRHDELEKVRHRVNELTNLMNDFLAQSESESIAQKYKPSPVDVVAICRSVINEMDSVTAGAEPGRLIQHIAPAQAIVNGDGKLLRHIFRNLISNAIKYSPDEHGTIIVSLSCADNEVTIEVNDNGIGIPEEDLHNLFTPFFRASNASKISGTGIGLSIVKEFIELHGGIISVHSVMGFGSTFSIKLPLLHDAELPDVSLPQNDLE